MNPIIQLLRNIFIGAESLFLWVIVAFVFLILRCATWAFDRYEEALKAANEEDEEEGLTTRMKPYKKP